MRSIGLDIGSLYLGLVVLDEEANPMAKAYRRHKGEPARTLAEMLPECLADKPFRLARTGSGAGALDLPGPVFDPVIAGLEGSRRLAPEARNALYMGGGSFYLIETDAHGSYRRSTLNSACASGTGAFLDQQALRLQVEPEQLAELASRYGDTPPAVATRCAVFAKSDLIHLQQEGYPVEAIAAGLCRGLGHATVDGLLGGRRLTGATVLIGGVARNRVVADAVEERMGREIMRIETPELAGAWGAALLARGEGEDGTLTLESLHSALRQIADGEGADTAAGFMRKPLVLEMSSYPDFSWADHWRDAQGNEVAIPVARSGQHTAILGLDIGSTSTKGVLLDADNEVIGWVYRKTAGDPIRAVQMAFQAFRALQARGGFDVSIRGVGVTGSGRKMIGRIIGADLVLNEITAHARAATFLDPEVDTILELGGQDAKFTQLQNGMVYNSVMNYVCAAGTGSFIEEQAQKLGVPLEDFADLAMDRASPPTSDRCTVYMERDLDRLLASGWERTQVAAAVLHSVRDNYLNKVVGGLHIGDHVCFQGATARNRALVAAFETGLGRPIRVSRYCHLTGALGMALLVRERIPEAKRSARFAGLSFADAEVRIEQETCEFCRNKCRLTLIHDGHRDPVAWGLKCGREYASRRPVAGKNPGYAYWQERNRIWSGNGQGAGAGEGRAPRARMGLPAALGTYGYYPFWRAFLQALNCEIVSGGPSTEQRLREGREVATAEFCAPVLMGHGHARHLLDDAAVDYLFVPHMIEADRSEGCARSYFCPYVQAHASVLGSLRGIERADRILAPVVSLAAESRVRERRLLDALQGPLGVGVPEIRTAWRAAEEAQKCFADQARTLGLKALREVEERRSLGIVCVGRPYNTVDAGLTLDLPRKVAAMGYTVLPLDMWPAEAERGQTGDNMYWHHGQRILAAADAIVRQPRWFGIYFTHFMCGPDSYLLTYFREVMARAGKPYLCLQLDGHGADAGYLTRIEAALETFHAWSGIPAPDAEAL